MSEDAIRTIRSSLSEKRILRATAFVLALAFVFVLQSSIDNERKSAGLSYTSNSGLKSGSSTMFELLGGLRTATAAFLWIKVDRIHDNYYGTLKKESELIPLYRMITWLNPHIDEAYYVGSYMLYQFKQTDEAWRFNSEGIKQNPQSGKLELNAGQFILAKLEYGKLTNKDYEDAIRHFRKALSLGNMEDDEFILAYKGLSISYSHIGLSKEASQIENELKTFRGMIDK
jgi:tetratricopeptide (TPR) repeat protein